MHSALDKYNQEVEIILQYLNSQNKDDLYTKDSNNWIGEGQKGACNFTLYTHLAYSETLIHTYTLLL